MIAEFRRGRLSRLDLCDEHPELVPPAVPRDLGDLHAGQAGAGRAAQRVGLGRIDADRVEKHREVIVGHYGLSVEVPRGVQRTELIELMKHDKKAVDGLTFVLDSCDGIQTVHDVSEHAVNRAFDALSVP